MLPTWILETADIFVWQWENAPAVLIRYLEEEIEMPLSDVSWIALVRAGMEIPSWMEEGSTFGCSGIGITSVMLEDINKLYSKPYKVVIGYHA